MESSPQLVFCTCPDPDTATRLAEQLVEQRLAACVNLLPGLTSVYRWQDQIAHDRETLLLIKSSAERFGALSAWLKEAHPYEVPEIIAVALDAGVPEYLAWMAQSMEETA